MPTPANPTALAQQARRSYVERLIGGMPAVVQAVDQGARALAAAVAEPTVAMKRRELVPTLQATLPLWLQGMTTLLRASLDTGTVAQTRLGELPVLPGQRAGKLSLVDDDTIEHEILSSRLALAMMDRASWEFTDLRSRMNVLEGREELETNDVLRPHVLARVVTNSWLAAPLGFDAWRVLQTVLHDELSHFAEETYHETNRFLLARNVLPEVDLRPFIRRSNHGGPPPTRTGRQRRLRHADRHRAAAGHRLPAVGDQAGRGRVARGRRGDADDDPRRRPGARSRPGRGGARPPEPAGQPAAARLRPHLDRAASALAAAQCGDRPGAGQRRPAPLERRRRRGEQRRAGDRHAGPARGAAPEEAGAQGGRGDAGRAGDDRDRRPAVPEHPDGRRDSGDGARLVRAPADAGAARRGLASPTSSPRSSIRPVA